MAIDFLESYKRGTDMQSRDLGALRDLYAQQGMTAAKFKREDEAIARDNKRYVDKLSYDLATRENEILEEADRRNKQLALDQIKLKKEAAKDKAEAEYKTAMLKLREAEVKNKNNSSNKSAYDSTSRLEMRRFDATMEFLKKDWENKTKKHEDFLLATSRKPDPVKAQKLADEAEAAKIAFSRLGAKQDPISISGPTISRDELMPMSGQLSGRPTAAPVPAPMPAPAPVQNLQAQPRTKEEVKEWIRVNYPNEKQNWPTIFKNKMLELSNQR